MAKDYEGCVRAARRMGREMSQRLDRGDINRVAAHMEVLLKHLLWREGRAIGDIIDWLMTTKDGEHWLNVVMVYWGPREAQNALEVCTGMTRTQWLDFAEEMSRCGVS